jgi:hypothetical protein
MVDCKEQVLKKARKFHSLLLPQTEAHANAAHFVSIPDPRRLHEPSRSRILHCRPSSRRQQLIRRGRAPYSPIRHILVRLHRGTYDQKMPSRAPPLHISNRAREAH